MKISPLSSAGLTVGSVPSGEPQQSMAQKVRALRMNTNATPGRIVEPLPEAEALSTSPVNGDVSNAVAEETAPLSPQLAAIARQRRALQVKEREIADRERALATQASSPDASSIDVARLKSDPLGVLLESGVTYDQLAEAVVAAQSGVNPQLQSLEAKIKSLEEGFDKKLTDRDAQTEQQALAEMQRDASRIIAQDDEFELVRETKSLPDVMELIKRTYKQTGEVLDVTEALQLVEEELISESLKLANLKKVQSRIAPPAPVLPPTQQQRQMRTLTNRDTASVPLDRKQRALAAFYGHIKQ